LDLTESDTQKGVPAQRMVCGVQMQKCNKPCATICLAVACHGNCFAQVGGVLVMAPEHRNSLWLKYLELALAGKLEVAQQLLELIEGLPYYDILDESDEVLHTQ